MTGEDTLRRLEELGLGHTVTLAASATIVDSGAETLPHPRAAIPIARQLPRLSIDLRRSLAARGGDVHREGADLEVRGLLGEGGMGVVFVAHQHSIGRDVAVKTAKDGATDGERAAVLLEGAITGQLEHPAIVPVHALGVDETGRPAMVMKRIEGVAWEALLEDPAHAGWEGWQGDAAHRLPGHLEILMLVSNAVFFAHSRGIVHRDIKLENVLIGRFGDVYLADWGVAARISDETARGLCGTPGYMAPEMVVGDAVDERTDVYLLGATLHHVLTGRLRHDGETALAALSRALTSAPFAYPEGVPKELGDLCNDACHRDPARRPPSAKAFRESIAAYLRHRDSAALSAEASERLAQCRVLAARDALDEDGARELDRLAAQAQFGLEQALRQWPSNPGAEEARAELEALLEQRRARAAEHERQARERDPELGARGRIIGTSLIATFSLVVIAAFLIGPGEPSRAALLAAPAILFFLLGSAMIVLRRQLLTNEFNRQTISLILVGFGLIAIGRIDNLLTPLDLHLLLARDLFAVGGMMVAGAIVLLRWLAWIAAVLVLGSFVILAFPHHANILFGAAMGGAVVLGAVLARWKA